jgi:hypothetical protein
MNPKATMEVKRHWKGILVVFSPFLFFLAVVATGIGRIEDLWLILPLGTARVSTWITIVLCFEVVLYLQNRINLKSLYYAFLAVIFFMGLFEFVWFYTAVGMRSWGPRIYEFAALFGWILLGIREVIHVRPPRLSVLFYGLFVIFMALWIGTGFQFNDLGGATFSVVGETLNVAAKAAIAAGYAFHLGSKKS